MSRTVFFILMLAWGGFVYGQEKDCKVMIANLEGSYSGGCKKGLAHGKGAAKGIDQYEGQFYKGVPNGKGTYTWSDGSFYVGEWKNGLREGKGKLVTADSTLAGYWKNNEFIGEEVIPPYVINSSLSVTRSTIQKTAGSLDGVRIRIMQGGNDNSTIEDFMLAYDSGDEYRMGPIYGIQNNKFPIQVHVRYRTWNQLHSVQYNVFFDFTINEAGTWDVVITN